jgi:acetyl-CoA C-acetyltransferase
MSGGRAIILAARRTAIGRLGGLHRHRRIETLAAPVIRAVLDDAGLAPEDVDEVILGNAVGGGGNPARLSALAAGLPDSVAGVTVDRQCASGLDAVVIGAGLIASGTAEVVIAGGAEAASTAPWRVARPANPYTDLPVFYSQPAFAPAERGDPAMVEAAETVARRFGISRERQDAFALASHAHAIAAAEAGLDAAEIVALGPAAEEMRDEGPRRSLSAKLLARMPPLVGETGTVTAGNSCQINDGAAALVLVSEAVHRRLGSPPGLVFAGAASAGIAPDILGLAAVPAVRKLCRKTGRNISDFAAIEFNEAFAAQVLASTDALDIDPARLNITGGSLAYGHPYGASGALLVVRLFTRLLRQETAGERTLALAMIAAAGGVGVAALFETVRR